MDRRSFVKAIGFSAAGLAIPKNFDYRKFLRDSNRKPNIVFILTDDLGYGDLGSYGQTKIRTPFIDKIASEGIQFTNCYSGSPVCAPSRNCLMTGQHTGHIRIRHNKSSVTKERISLEPTDVTVAEVLKKAGYTTGLIGKWGLGEPGTQGIPNKKGFDYFFGYLNQNHAHFYYPEYLWRNEEKIFYPENKNKKRVTYSHDLFVNEALAFIDKNKNTPFFLYLALTIPHAELLVPEDSLNEYKGKFPEDKPFGGEPGGYAAQDYPRAAYAAMITRMDRDVGRLMNKLEELGIDDDTIVFFTSDNGPSDEAGSDPEFFGSTGSLRGGKTNLYEGGIRIPMLVRYRGKIKPGISNHTWAFWDFLPTVTELVNNVPLKDIDGISILPLFFGKEQKQHDYLYWEIKTNKKEFNQAVRIGNWKAVRSNPEKPVELYDLTIDQSEKNDLSSRHAGIVKRVEKIMIEARTESKHWPMYSKD